MNTLSRPKNITTIGNAEVLPLNTQTIPPYTTTNTIIYGKNRFIVIDPATKDQEHQCFLKEHIMRRIDSGHTLLGIYLSHHHSDHVGAADILSKFFHTPIFAHKNAREHLSFDIHHHLNDGDKIIFDEQETINVLYTPGHTDSHVVFYEQKTGALIAGDMITDSGTILIPPDHGSLRIYLKSLDRLCKLKLSVIFPAHGRAITKTPNVFLQSALEHRVARINQTLNAIRHSDVALDSLSLAQKIYGCTIEASLMPFAKLSLESGIKFLLEDGLIKRCGNKWQAINQETNHH